MIGGCDRPGEFDEPLKVAAHHTGLSGLGVQALQPRELLAAFLFDRRWQVRLINALPQCEQVGSRGIEFAQFFLNGFELLAEEILMLGLADLLLHFGLDAALHGHHFQFFVQQFANAA